MVCPAKERADILRVLYCVVSEVIQYPTFGGRKADTVDLTLLDKFIKRHMPSVYELLSVDGLPIVDEAIE